MTQMTTDPDAALQAYHLAVEETFGALRGRRVLLAPADFQLVSSWHHQGIPLDLVQRTLEAVAAQRRARGQHGAISSLRYFAPAVADAWAARRPRG